MRKVLMLAVLAVFTTLTPPARAQFCPGAAPWVFDDVPAGDLFCGYITWAAQNGITLGCAIIDPNHRLFCPNDAVKRSEMAAFVNRLGNVRVEAVGTGPGLTGGPITSIGTINLAATNLLPTTACTNNQIPRWNGSAWACSTDANSGGTVTSVGSGTGLAGGPITTSGSLSIATGYQLPQGCTNGQVAKSSGSNAWTCASDADSGGTMTSITAGNGLTGGTITTSGTIAVDTTALAFTDKFFQQGGNAFGGIASAVLGTSNNLALDIIVNDTRALRLEPYGTSPNVIGGHANNSRDNAFGNIGSVIAGGGKAGANCFEPSGATFTRTCANLVRNNFAAVGGGDANQANGDHSTVAGGQSNTAAGANSFVGGGFGNAAGAGFLSSIGGGNLNVANGNYSTVGGGDANRASGSYATVGGGTSNVASGTWATVGGGVLNLASGAGSFAAGYNAQTQTNTPFLIVHDGTFVFSDFSNLNAFHTTTGNEFAVRATGGVRFVTAVDPSGDPVRTVKITANGELDFGFQTRQMLNLWGAGYGIGVQGGTQYFRSDIGFAWFEQGVHSDATYDPGAGGVVLMTLQPGSSSTTVTGTARAQSFVSTSDRNVKTAFAPLDGEEVLAKVAAMPVTSWAYRNEPDVRHIGPVAQDFHAAFGVGSDDRTINTVDASGVALAAIQGLNAKLEAAIVERDARVDAQAREIAQQRREIAELKRVQGVALAAIQGLNAKLEAAIVERDARIDAQAREIAELKRAVDVLLARTSPEGRIAAK